MQEIKVLYTSDIHGHAMPIHYGKNTEEAIGLTKYATVVKEMRAAHNDLIVLDNGDFIQGTPFMTNYVKNFTSEPNPLVHVLNTLQLDAAILGNHEFNFGKNVLQQAVDEAEFPVLSANILNQKTGEPAYGPPYLIKKLSNDLNIAIIGATTHYIPNWESAEHIKGLEFEDAFVSVQRWVDYVKTEEKPDIIIVSYHGGFEADIETGKPIETYTGENQAYKMATEIDGIDVLLTGHQHRLLTGKVNDCLIIQPGKHGSHYGEITLHVERAAEGNWQIVHKEAEIKDFTSVATDEATYTYLQPFETSTQNWLDQSIGKVKGDMTLTDSFQARIEKHPFIQFIQDVQIDASGVDMSLTSLLNNESQGFPTTVTMRDVVANFMYPNTLTVLELTGRDIKAALEQSANYFILNDAGDISVNPDYLDPKPQHYNYDMWEGIHYTIHVSKPFGDKVSNLTYDGEPLNPHATYEVVLNNYRASGGGNFSMFPGKKVIKEIQQDAVQLIQNYFEKYPVIEAKTIVNFTVKK